MQETTNIQKSTHAVPAVTTRAPAQVKGAARSRADRQGVLRRHLALLVPLLLVVTWMTASNLYFDTAWVDEVHSVEDAGGPPTGPLNPAQIWERVATTNAWHTPGYFILLSGWARLVGWEPPILRALSLLFGLLTIAWTYRLGRDVVSPRVGLYGALVLAASAFFAHFMHEIRMYTLITAVTAFETWLYFRIVTSRREPNRVELGLLFFGAASLLYLHYFAAMPLFGLCLYHLLFVKKDRRWWQVVIAFGLAGLCFIPWLSALATGLRLAAGMESLHNRAMTWDETVAQWLRVWGNGAWPFLALLVALALTALRGRARLFVVVGLAAIALTIGVNAALRIMHLGRLRYLLPAWPLLSLVVAVGIVQIERWLPGTLPGRGALPVLALAGWVAIGGIQTANPNFADGLDGTKYVYQIHHAAYAIRDVWQTDDVIVQILPEWSTNDLLNTTRYTKDTYFTRVPDDRYLIYPRHRPAATLERQYARDLLVQDLLETPDRQRVWVLYPPDGEPSLAVEPVTAALQDRYYQCPAPVDRPESRAEQFTLAPVCCLSNAMSTAPVLTFGSGIGLVAAEPVVGARSGGSVDLFSLWSMASDVPPYQYSATFQLFDGQGNKVAQADHELRPQSLTCEPAILSLENVPPGDYELRVAVYDWQTGERLMGQHVATGATAEMLAVQAVHVGDEAPN